MEKNKVYCILLEHLQNSDDVRASLFPGDQFVISLYCTWKYNGLMALSIDA